MKKPRLQVIQCPFCEAEYLPAEIFLPNVFLGKPSNIIKDYAGKIIDFSGDTMETLETYQCDNCDKVFKVKATIEFNSRPVKEEVFEEEYSSPINRGDLFLDEEYITQK